MLDLIWLIPLLPLAGVAVNGIFGRRMDRQAVGWVACAVVLVAFLLSCGAVWQLAQLPPEARTHEATLGAWMPLGPVSPGGRSLDISWDFVLDPLSAVLLLVVTGVGLLIHVYSIGYMEHEPDVARFFTYLNLFMAMMLVLVLAGNLLVLFVGWEGVGLCSYLLIGFYYDRPFDARTGLSCADAGRKAFIVNRIGDFAFLIAMVYLALAYGTLDFRELSQAFAASGEEAGVLLAGVGLLLFIGACGKSAQIPLYVWLPDAMAGPTPVSALIHAATMVTAGVYMVCRMSHLYAAAPEALIVVATVGALTALFAATMGVTATDIKKVLAYSTVSQLGFMFAAAGVGAYIAAIFHLMTHAFFKALLFLGAGSVIHGLHGEQDIRSMGGLARRMPVTHLTFVAAWLAIAGIFPFAGFFSKDEILAGAWFSGHPWVFGFLAAAAVLTAFYMTRLVYLVFWGRFRGSPDLIAHAHESPSTMLAPLVILAGLSLAGGWIGVPRALSGKVDLNVFHHWLEPAIAPASAHAVSHVSHAPARVHDTGAEIMLMAFALGLSLAGMLLAWSIYRREGLSLASRLAHAFGPVYTLVRNMFWVDELYDLVVVRPFYALSRFFTAFDRLVVDGLVNATGVITELTGQIVKLFQTGLVRNYALMFLIGVVAILYYLASF